MNIEEQLKKRLCIPDNWDKHDYEHGRYCFNDVLDIVEELVKANSVLGGVMKQRELLKSFCDYAGIDQLVNEDDLIVDIENHVKHFNSL